jgi:hypothetical protein
LQGLLLDRPIPDVILDEDISLVDMQVTTNVSIDGDCHQSDQGVKNLGFSVSHDVVVWDDDVEEVLNELTWDEEWVQEVESYDSIQGERLSVMDYKPVVELVSFKALILMTECAGRT